MLFAPGISVSDGVGMSIVIGTTGGGRRRHELVHRGLGRRVLGQHRLGGGLRGFGFGAFDDVEKLLRGLKGIDARFDAELVQQNADAAERLARSFGFVVGGAHRRCDLRNGYRGRGRCDRRGAGGRGVGAVRGLERGEALEAEVAQRGRFLHECLVIHAARGGGTDAAMRLALGLEDAFVEIPDRLHCFGIRWRHGVTCRGRACGNRKRVAVFSRGMSARNIFVRVSIPVPARVRRTRRCGLRLRGEM